MWNMLALILRLMHSKSNKMKEVTGALGAGLPIFFFIIVSFLWFSWLSSFHDFYIQAHIKTHFKMRAKKFIKI